MLVQQDLLKVVRKYIQIDEDQVKLSVDREGDCKVLELNVSLSDKGGISPSVRAVTMKYPRHRATGLYHGVDGGCPDVPYRSG
jgi:hypothetical protein